MMEYAEKTNKECIELLKYIFSDAQDFYSQVAPDGWVNSPFVHFLHPTANQQYEEHKRFSENISRLTKQEDKETKKVSEKDFEQDDLNGINDVAAFEEFIYILGQTVYDIFSKNHQVIGPDNKVFDLGSFRGSGRFIAEFINMHYPKAKDSYMYLDFYMGSIWINDRGDLTPFYEFIFQKLKDYGCDWHYSFERDVEEARDQPLIPVVQAYKNVFGKLPRGHPQEGFE